MYSKRTLKNPSLNLNSLSLNFHTKNVPIGNKASFIHVSRRKKNSYSCIALIFYWPRKWMKERIVRSLMFGDPWCALSLCSPLSLNKSNYWNRRGELMEYSWFPRSILTDGKCGRGAEFD